MTRFTASHQFRLTVFLAVPLHYGLLAGVAVLAEKIMNTQQDERLV